MDPVWLYSGLNRRRSNQKRPKSGPLKKPLFFLLMTEKP